MGFSLAEGQFRPVKVHWLFGSKDWNHNSLERSSARLSKPNLLNWVDVVAEAEAAAAAGDAGEEDEGSFMFRCRINYFLIRCQCSRLRLALLRSVAKLSGSRTSRTGLVSTHAKKNIWHRFRSTFDENEILSSNQNRTRWKYSPFPVMYFKSEHKEDH